MRNLTAAVLVAGATMIAGQAVAADLPYYPPVIEIPDVDHGYSGSFYLRGSAGLNLHWAPEVTHTTLATGNTHAIDQFGYGYSAGVGVGFETGTGWRFDATVDHLQTEGLQTTIGAGANAALTQGPHQLSLRSTVVLANAYYDFGLGNDYGYGAAGGMFGYVGAGAGVAFNRMVTQGSALPDTWGSNTSPAAAAMVGVGYDFGQVVADVGYRGLYIHDIANSSSTFPYSVKNNFVHEVRGTVRYRFN